MSDPPPPSPPPPPPNAPPPMFQAPAWRSPAYQPPPGWAGPTAPDYAQPYQQPKPALEVAAPIGFLGASAISRISSEVRPPFRSSPGSPPSGCRLSRTATSYGFRSPASSAAD